MKNKPPTPLADTYLKSIEHVQEAETDPFFYTRLKARMERESVNKFSFYLKPSWLLTLLGLFFFINCFVLINQLKQKPAALQNSSLQNFAKGYDLSISTSF